MNQKMLSDKVISMEYGIGSYTYTWMVKKNLDAGEGLISVAKKLVDKAVESNLKLVQICDNLPLHEFSENDLRELGRYCEELMIKLQIGTRGLYREHLKRYLHITDLCGARLVRTMCPDLRGNETDAKTAINELRASADDYESSGVYIAIENHDKNSSEELASIIKETASENIRLCLDTVNSFAALESPEYTIKNMLPYTINIHLKDFDVVRVNNQMGFSIEGRPLGEGRLEKYMKTLVDSGAGDAIIELWTPLHGNIDDTINIEAEWARKSVEYVKNTFQKGERYASGT